jgi:ABC-type uncharacterized transport system fused permease/ATPase subunit
VGLLDVWTKPVGEMDAGGSAQAAQKKRVAATTRASLRALLLELFDLRGWLAGRTGVQLHGAREVAALGATLLVRVFLIDRWQLFQKKLAETLYTRNRGLFQAQIVQFAGISLATHTLRVGLHYLTGRLAVCWREALTKSLHAQYLSGRVFYTLAQRRGPAGIADPGERMCTDVELATQELADSLQSILATSVNAVWAIVRLAISVDIRYVFICVAFLITTEAWREYFVPALRLGQIDGRVAKARGEYRQAQSRLIQHSQSVVSGGAGRVAAERLAIESCFDQYLTEYKKSLRADEFEWTVYKGLVAEIILPMFLQLLVHLPILLQSNNAVVGGATIETNAALLGRMVHAQLLIRVGLARMRAMMTIRRRVLKVTGNANRIVELLDSAKQLGKEEESTVDPGSHKDIGAAGVASIGMIDATIQMDDREQLCHGLHFSSPQGKNVVVTGPGRAAVMRGIAGLAPLRSGKLVRPAAPQVGFCVPYVAASGSVKDWIAYPAGPVRRNLMTICLSMHTVPYVMPLPCMTRSINTVSSGI